MQRAHVPAVILAAGTGFRLNAGRPAPKCLTPVLGRPLLEWITDALATAGVQNIHLVLGCHADQVRQALPTIHTSASISTSTCPDWESVTAGAPHMLKCRLGIEKIPPSHERSLHHSYPYRMPVGCIAGQR